MNPVYGYDPGSPDLLAWWTFDEGSGIVAGDASGNGNDGILQDDPIVVNGKFGQALTFEGNRVAIDASDSLTADLFQGSFTLSAWINPTRTGNMWQQIFRSIRADDTSNDTLFVNNDGRLSWRGYVDGAWVEGMCETTPDVVAAYQWTHVTVTSDETNFRIYVNGDLSQESAFRITDGPNATYYIGGDPMWTDESYTGMIDDVRIYNTALTEFEILTAMEGVEKIDGDSDVALPEGWQSLDIGTTGGRAAEIDGAWAISADGADIWWKSDEFHFVFMPLSGDGTIVARVVDNGNGSDTWAKGGVMIRETLEPDSKHAMMLVSGGSGGGKAFQHRPITGQPSFSAHGGDQVTPPIWVKLSRVGDTFTGYYSFDGVNWIEQENWSLDGGVLAFNPATIEMARDVYIGLFVTSHKSGELRTYTFDNVSVINPVDVTALGDLVQGVPNDGITYDSGDFGWYSWESPDLVIDDNLETKYLHFKGEIESTGFQVTPTSGPSIVTGLTLTTANDFPARDPIAFELYGSNDSIDGPYELIASGDIVDFAQVEAWPRFTMNATPISFYNDMPYEHYQVLFPAVRDAGSANSMQIAEVELLGVPAPSSAHIILVTEGIDWDLDGLRDDHALESFLVSKGYNVDVRPDYWEVLIPDKIDELEAADLIIFSRSTWSDHYSEGNEITQWNSLDTPLLQMNPFFARDFRWNWVNTDTATEGSPYIYAEAVEPYHPVFSEVLLTVFDPTDPDSPMNVVQIIDPLIGSGLVSFIGTTDMGNGHLIAKPLQLSMGWIAEWNAGVEFYEGSGQYAGGRRMLFSAGTQEIQYYDNERQEVMTTTQGELNLTAEGLQMLNNAIDYLLLPESPRGRESQP